MPYSYPAEELLETSATLTVYAPLFIFCGIVRVPLKVTLLIDKLIGESILVRLVASVLPNGPVRLTCVVVFLIPAG